MNNYNSDNNNQNQQNPYNNGPYNNGPYNNGPYGPYGPNGPYNGPGPYNSGPNYNGRNFIRNHEQIKKLAIAHLVLSLCFVFGFIFIVYIYFMWIFGLVAIIASLVILIVLICKVGEHKNTYGTGVFVCLIIGIFIPIVAWIADCITMSRASKAIREPQNPYSYGPY
ncbi:MAG: hypothetical protein HUJ42_02010 [Malacoplasma sp.]|nr:hypothetical protein [Malacoplasma sp.]